VLALTAVVRPILRGVLYAIKREVVAEMGGYEGIKLKILPRAYLQGDGDCGICFEYAVHEALRQEDGRVVERISDAAKLCRLNAASTPKSILFGLEKTGSQQLIDTADNILTPESRLLHGTRGQPVKLRKHLSGIATAFRKREAVSALPYSIRGLWKADLFVGFSDEDRWVATTVKINRNHLEGAPGLRIGIVPAGEGASDAIVKDESKNLIICPLHHDRNFMQIFYEGWRVVQAFIKAQARVPKEVVLPSPAEREVARILEQRQDFPVVDVIDALGVFSQPGLLVTDDKQVQAQILSSGQTANTDMVVAPTPLQLDLFDH
jgi:hypothetical protein